MTIGWDTHNEKLRCMIVVSDDIAAKLTNDAGEAFARAFIVEDRQSGKITGRLRFRYTSEDSWYEIHPDQNLPDVIEDTVLKMREVFSIALSRLLGVPSDDKVVAFYPPDDGGNPERTIHWLQERDLIRITHPKAGEA